MSDRNEAKLSLELDVLQSLDVTETIVDAVGSAANTDDLSLFRQSNLEDVRKRLLDLTARSPLLNYKHPTGSSLRVVNTSTDSLHTQMISGQHFELLAVPEPSEAELIAAGYVEIDPDTDERVRDDYPSSLEWARHLGISTSSDLSPQIDVEGHRPDRVQTLLFVDSLEARLKEIGRKTETSIEERGANILYLAIGFLEWFENKDSDTVRRAPLLVLPAKLERAPSSRAGGRRASRLISTGEDLIANLTLEERLRRDFALELPAHNDDIGIEAWFIEIERIVKQLDPRWQVTRAATIGLWDFAKQAMYLDLDPARWGDESPLTSHPIIKKLFSDAEQCETNSDDQSYGDEYLIDGLDSVNRKYPLIFDADSSQHSAVVDAVNGRNLVIEGPPGTGKSQTITNLIAASIAAGKRVLFVAEKKDALEVVARRLKEAGLDDLCLELHSHKANKVDVLASIVGAADRRSEVTSPNEMDRHLHRYENLRKQLESVAVQMNSPWGNSGLTPHQILQKARELADRDSLPVVSLVNIEASTLSDNTICDVLDKAERLTHAANQVATQAEDGVLESHLWFGLGRSDLQTEEKQSLLACVSDWNDALSGIAYVLDSMSTELGSSAASELSPVTAALLAKDLSELPAEVTEALFRNIEEFATHQGGLQELLSGYRVLVQRFDSLGSAIRSEVLLNQGAADEIRRATDCLLEELGIVPDNSIQDIERYFASVCKLISLSSELRDEVAVLENQLPALLAPVFEQSEEGWKALHAVLDTINRLPMEIRDRRDARLDNELARSRVRDFAQRLKSINGLTVRLSGLFDLDTVPELPELREWQRSINNAGMLGIFKSNVRRARAGLRGCASSNGARRKALEAALPELRDYKKQIEALHKLENDDPILGPLYRGLDTPIEQLMTLAEWYAHVGEHYGRGTTPKAQLGKTLCVLDTESLNTIQGAIDDGLTKRLETAQQSFSQLSSVFPRFAQTLPPRAAFCAVGQHIDCDTNEGDNGCLPLLASMLKEVLAGLHQAVLDPSLSIADARKAAIRWRDLLKEVEHWRESDTAICFMPSLFALPLPGDMTLESAAERDLVTAVKLASIAKSSPNLTQAYQRPDPHLVHTKLVAKRAKLIEACMVERTTRKTIVEFGRINEEHGFASLDHSLNKFIARNNLRLENPDWLDAWQSWERVKMRAAGEQLGEIASAIQSGELQLKDVQAAIESTLYRLLAEHLLETTPSISRIEGLEQNALREQFRRADRKLIELQRLQILHRAAQISVPAGNAQGRVGSYTDMALVRHEQGKKRKHIAIRSLLSRASDAVTSLKPCFMMSPMSVAQYLEPGQFEFDLIVMDEASQIRPEEAIGAIARAKQFVVVGDPKQLPPTNFFQKSVEDSEDENEDVGLQQSESILDAVMPVFYKRRLRWHYRSRHESLIDFSNKNFYDSNLVVFPSPAGATDEFGVKSEWVNGVFLNQLNSIEAENIVDLLANQLIHKPDETVGVVAMNAKQAEHIELKLEERAASDPVLANAMQHSIRHGEKLFVKNLERVQGDERDVIIISMTYGPATSGGRTPQRFGPVNSATGWRRLNVLLTRARKRMHIISSMRSSDVLVSSTSSKGVRSLRALLQYCEHGTTAGTINPTGREPDSDFERAVIQRLKDKGYSCVPQLGVAGYFLDIAVLDPNDPGRFLLAIECDGATYHSAKSARDRDRLRQDVLEGLGWKVHRIWSTDWFRAPDAQIVSVLNVLDSNRL